MKHFRFYWLWVALVIFGAHLGWAATYDIDLAHSEVGFKIRHLVSKTSGRFDRFSGTIDFDGKKAKSLKTNVKIETTSVNTNDEKRDNHLRNPDFFNTEKYPEMTFVSTKAKKAGENKFKVTGDLTLLDVTKKVTLDVEYLGSKSDPYGNVKNGFTVSGLINRKDWGMEYNVTDKGGLVIGNEVEILIEIEGLLKK